MKFTSQKAEPVRIFLGGRISKPGPYIGKFDKVYEHPSTEPGSESMGLFFEFTSNQGQTNRWYLNVIKRDGEENEIGMAEIQGQIMPLLGIKTLKEKPNDPMIFYDFDKKADVTRRVTSYPQLMGKEIGVFFKAELNDFAGKTTTVYRPDFFFDPKTNQTAEELENDKPANTMVLKLDKLNSSDPEYKKYLDKKAETHGQSAKMQPPTKDNFSDDDFGDSIPF